MHGVDAALHRVAELESGFGGLLRPACNGEGGGPGGGRGGGSGSGGRGGGDRNSIGRDGRTDGRSSALSQLQGLSDKLHALNTTPERDDDQLAVPSFSRISSSAPAARPPPALVHVAIAGRPQSAGAACHSITARVADPSAPRAARPSSAAAAVGPTTKARTERYPSFRTS